MNKRQIKVRSKRGKIYTVMAEISEILKSDGSRNLLGLTDNYYFEVIDTNFYGHVFRAKRRNKK